MIHSESFSRSTDVGDSNSKVMTCDIHAKLNYAYCIRLLLFPAIAELEAYPACCVEKKPELRMHIERRTMMIA